MFKIFLLLTLVSSSFAFNMQAYPESFAFMAKNCQHVPDTDEGSKYFIGYLRDYVQPIFEDEIENLPYEIHTTTENIDVFTYLIRNEHEYIKFLNKLDILRAFKGNSVVINLGDKDCMFALMDEDKPDKDQFSIAIIELPKIKSNLDSVQQEEDKQITDNIFWKLQMFMKIIKAVAEVNQFGYIIRNIKADKVLMIDSFSPVLTGFNEACEITDSDKDILDTQVVGINPKNFVNNDYTLRYDLFKLGLLFYSLMTNQPEVTDLNKIILCEDDIEFKRKNPFYCLYLEPFTISMVQTDNFPELDIENTIKQLKQTVQLIQQELTIEKAKARNNFAKGIDHFLNYLETHESNKVNRKEIKRQFNQFETLRDEKEKFYLDWDEYQFTRYKRMKPKIEEAIHIKLPSIIGEKHFGDITLDQVRKMRPDRIKALI